MPFSVTSGRLNYISTRSLSAKASESFCAAASRQQHRFVRQQVDTRSPLWSPPASRLADCALPVSDCDSRPFPPAAPSSSPRARQAPRITLLVLWSAKSNILHHLQLAVAQLRRKRRAQRAQLHLARQLIGIARAVADRAPCRHAATAGERIEPMRARPVPFCFHSFLPEPGHFMPRLGLGVAAAPRRPDNAAPLHTAASSFTSARRTPRRPAPAAPTLRLFRSIMSTLGMLTLLRPPAPRT